MSVTSEEIEKWKERVAHYANALNDAPEEIRDNPEVVMASIRSNLGIGLKFAGPSVKDNYDVVLAFVSKYGDKLQYASESLRDNPEIVMAAIQSYGFALEYASDRLKNDPVFVKKAVETSYFALDSRGESLKDNLEILVAAANNIPKITFPDSIHSSLLDLIKQMSSAIENTIEIHSASEIAEEITPRQGEMDDIMLETKREVAIHSLDSNDKIHNNDK